MVSDAFERVHHLPWTRKPWEPANLLATPPVLRRLVLENDYDIVHLHDPVAAFVGRYALRQLRRSADVKVVYTAHGFHFYEGAPKGQALVFRTLEWLASRWTDRLILINREDEVAAKRFPIPPANVRYFPGIGVDLSWYHPDRVSDEDVAQFRAALGVGPEVRLIALIAEFNPGKRHLDAVSALARSDRPEAHLVLAGIGPLEEKVREVARDLGVADRVHLLGFRRDIPVLLKASLALMLPSEREGLPRCIMEAAAMERPVLSTSIRGVSELVSEDFGVLTPVGDVEAMAATIREWTDDPAKAAAMGRRGREAMQKFDLQNLLRLHDDLYGQLLGNAED